MIEGIFQNLNWVDLAIFILVVWLLFTGIKKGLVKELLHLIGTVFSLFVCFHYYSSFSELFVNKLPLSASIIHVAVFLLLWLLSYLLFRFLEEGVFFVFKVEVQSVVDKWGSTVLAILRSVLIVSMAMFILLLSQNAYLKEQTLKSYSQKGLLNVAPNIYSSIYRDLIKPLFPSENINKHMSAVLRGSEPSRNSLKSKSHDRKESSSSPTK